MWPKDLHARRDLALRMLIPELFIVGDVENNLNVGGLMK